MQQAFLRQLDADREPYVFGTISAGNTPSLKTALRVGRRLVEVWTRLPAVIGATGEAYQSNGAERQPSRGIMSLRGAAHSERWTDRTGTWPSIPDDFGEGQCR
jgi:hypothetical protein